MVEAEEVVRVVAPLHLPQPLEVRISVGCAHAFDGLIRSSVVEVAAAARRALLGAAAVRRAQAMWSASPAVSSQTALAVTLKHFSLR